MWFVLEMEPVIRSPLDLEYLIPAFGKTASSSWRRTGLPTLALAPGI